MRLNVVLFSGGRGTASIASALVNHDQIALTSIVNAYDDGLSTGRIRAFVPGMLGPSDIRKNISMFMPNQERCQRALRRFLDHRFPEGTTRDEALANLKPLAQRSGTLPDSTLAAAFTQLTNLQLAPLADYCRAFLDYEEDRFREVKKFDYGDCAVGNVLFAGCYLHRGRDFNATIAEMAEVCESRATVLNATTGRNYVLVALKESGQFLPDESAIVSPQDDSAIAQIYLLDDYLTAAETAALQSLDRAGRHAFLSERSRSPEPDRKVLAALADADVIVYGPGTQHSSLFPTYLTNGIAEAIAANERAEKVFIANIALDHDIRSESADSLIHKFHTYMNRLAATDIPLAKLMSRAFIQTAEEGDSEPAQVYVPRAQNAVAPDGSLVVARNWESEGGRHFGGLIVDQLLLLLQDLRAVEVRPYRHTISIIVPVLDEERTVDQVLGQLEQLDISVLEVDKEIIVVDGGSADRSFELVKAHKGLRVYQTKPHQGRGAAIRLGFARARGNILVVFPSDNEYDVADIISVVQPILSDQFKAVIGSRAIKCLNLETRIHYIYGDSRLLYFLSKYGGMLISVLCLIIYNRYISDPLSTLKAYDRRLIDSLNLSANGVDLECEIIAKTSRRQEYILEVPVGYVPRTRAQGKKMTSMDGIKALVALFSYRNWHYSKAAPPTKS